MPEEIKPVNQKGYITPIVPDYESSLRGSSGPIDPYELMSGRLAALEKPSDAYFTNVPASVLPGTGRYEKIFPGEDMEEIYGQGQGWGSKMVNGVGKGLALTGTTFLQSTAGLLNGLAEWRDTGRFASFYDNDFNRKLDELNKELEDRLPNYYTQEERDRDWYDPKKLFSANFLWDGIVKNLGFAAGAALSAEFAFAPLVTGASKALSAIPKVGKLFSIGKAGEVLAATEQGFTTAAKATESLGKIKTLSDRFLGQFNVLSPGQRFVVAGLSTTGEAGFEAYQNLNKFRQDKIQEYKDTHGGMAPTGEDLEYINNLADNVGNSSFLLNTSLLSVTNYIQFQKILGSSYKAEKGVINSITREIGDVAKDAAGNLIAKPTKFGKVLSTINKIRPYTFSISEAVEEGAQYAISVGSENYYNKKYKSEDANWLQSLGEGIEQTLSTNEGMENVLIGGLSGALMTGRGRYREEKEKAKNTVEALAQFNKFKLSDFTKDTIDSVNRGIAIQQDRESSLQQGDILESKDLEADYVVNYLTPRIKYGRFDLVRSDIEDLRKMASTQEGFDQLQREQRVLPEDTREAFLARLTNLETTANNMKSLYQSLNLRYGNVVTKDGKPAYTPEVMDKMVYAATKIADYDKRILDLSSKLTESGIDALTIFDEVLKGEVDNYNKLLTDLETSNRPNKEEVIESLQDANELNLRREKFLNEFDEMKKNPAKFAEKEEIAPQDIKVGETVKIKTKAGEKEYVIGEEYYLGTVIKGTNEEGFEEVAFPIITILADNGDGTIKIKDSNGVVRDVEKSKLESFKLGKVSSLAKDKKGKFFYDNRNTLFEFNFGKGKKVQGRLEYSQKEGILLFKYFDKNGKPKSIEVTGDQFVAKEGYDQAMITPVGTITALQQKSLEDYAAEKDARIINKREARLNILTKMFDEASSKLEETKKLINRKYSEFEKITNDLLAIENKIKAGELTKKQSFKRTTAKAIQAANRLSRMQEELRKEIQALEAEQEELESLQTYVADMAQNIDELPTDSKEFIEELREQVKDLESLQLSTGIQINSISKLIDQTEGALNKAIDFVKELIGKFEKTYPNTPAAIVGQEWVDFLQSNPNFLKINTNFKEDLAMVEDLVAQVEDLDIIPGERTVSELREQLDAIVSNLSSIEEELSAKEKILSRFESIAAEYQRVTEENRKLQEDEVFAERIMKTADPSQRTLEDSEPFEEDSKKTNTNIPRSTIASQNLPGYAASQIFGNNFESFPNRKRIKAVIVTRKNQEEVLGEDVKLIEHLGQENLSEAEMDGTIAIVMVEEQADGSRKLVGVDGKPLESVSVENLVYQVMPTEELKWSEEYGGKSMFREGTPDTVKDALRKEYKAWRTETLDNPPTGTFSIDASFGNPQRVPQKDENGNVVTDKKGNPISDKDAQVSVSEAGLISEDSLENNKVLSIPTTNDVFNKGTTFFKNVRGRVFLTLKNGLVKLQNRKFSEKEANTIYQAISRLSEIMFQEGDVKSEEAQRLLNWLKTTVYWGTPKDAQGNRKAAGHNSIFFDRVEVTDESGKNRKSLRLFFSNKDGSIPFTPSYIKDNKSAIVSLIQKLYNNVNATRVNGGKKVDWAEPYEEILEIKPNGEIVSRQWQNYQTYLLSSKNPDGSARKNEELPLFTNIRPKENIDDANRQGVYFVLTDLKYKEPKVQAPPAKPAKIVPGAKVGAQPVESAEGEIDMSGKKINTFTSTKKEDGSGGKVIKWAYNPNKSGWQAIYVIPGGDLAEVLDELTEKFGEEKAKETIKKTIYNNIPREIIEQEEEGAIIIGEEEEDYYEDANTYVEPDPNEKASKEEEDDQADDIVIIEDNADEDAEIEERLRDRKRDRGNRRADLRVVVKDEIETFESENWTKIESWLKENFPNFPIYRVKNILKGTNGLQAWGMLKDGALYIYENAEAGTIYHEVFEGVWKTLSDPKERKAVIKEFTSRKGTFIDRPTGQVIAYKDATNSQVKEQLAEEFRDYVQYGKVPVKPADGRPYIVRLFADIVNTIKNFFANTPDAKNNTERLFQKINTGYYKKVIPFETNLSFAKQGIIDIEDATIDRDSELRLRLSGETVHDVMQELTYLTLLEVVGNNEDLFNVQGKNKEELYRTLKYELGNTILDKAFVAREMVESGEITKQKGSSIISEGIATWKNVMRQWDEIVKKHAEYLRSYNIEFDENDELNVRSDENTGRGEYDSSDKIDYFRKTNSAIKLLLSTLPIMEDGREQLSSIGGAKLLPLSQVYISLMNNLHTSKNIDEMIERIRQMAIADENYRKLYKRLTGTSYETNTFDFSDLLENHQLQLVTAIWTTFKKQNPDAQTVFIFENGDVSVGSSNLSTAARQIKREYETAISSTMRKKNPYFEYSDEKKVFVGKPGGISAVRLTSPAAQSDFLSKIGIRFNEEEIENLPADKRVTFDNAVSGIRDSIKSADKIATVSGKVLDIEGRLLELGLVRAYLDNPEFDSTFFNVKGERTQTFMGTNAISDFFDAISQIDNLNDLVGTQYEYLLTDEFAEGSVILGKMFNLKTGERKDSVALMKAGYVDGTVNNKNGKKKQSSKLTYKERLVQEINTNLQGYYTNLVPADASMEHTAYMGNAITEKSLLSGFDNIFKIFGKYLESEVKLSRNTDRKIVQDKKGTRKESDLRFFKGILGEELHNKIVKDKSTPAEEIYAKYKKQVDAAVEQFIKKDAQKVKQELTEYGVISVNANEEIVVENIAFEKNEGMSDADLNRQLNALSANYIISNIELHKLIYSDPYQYEDELKRIKNFLSPRQPILYGSAKMNEAMNSVYNRNFKSTDAGRTNFNRDYFRTISYKDVLGAHDLPGYDDAAYKETDGSGIISFKAYRNFRLRAGKWSAANEAQYRYDMAWEKRYKNKEKLSAYEKEILADGNPEVRSTYTTEKPIVAGNKANDASFNDVVLDKYALYPLSFRVMMEINPKSNAIKLYDKMQKEDIDYVIFDSGRKVGAVDSVSLYNEKGEFNTEPYNEDSVVNIPFAIMSVQTEVPSKEDEIVTRGSQVTKLVTMDFMEAGVPVDFMDDSDNFEDKYVKWIKLTEEEKLAYNNGDNLYKEIKNNQMLLEAMIDNGYQVLLDRMGIEEVIKDGEVVDYNVKDFSQAAKTLREEILKRETNDNIIDALDDFISGKAVLEATPAYQQVRNILYSIADKNVISPKITGGMKVQIPSTLLESVRAEAKTIKTKDGKTKTVYTSENLKFYKNKDGERVCEIMVGRWFKSDMTDDELMEYFKSDEGKKILSGVGFRIPTQKQNSIDAFVIKRLLPAEFGDNVIVPAEIVNKQGSDFDIDKLSLYLKNLYTDTNGNLKLIPYFGTGAEALSKFEDMFYDILQEKIDVAEGGKKKISGLKDIISSIVDKTASKKTKNKWLPILRDMFGEDLTINELEEVIEQKIEAIVGRINDLSDQNVQDKFMDRFKQTMYKKSLENAYVESLEKLVTHPKNFDQLVKPNSAEQLKDIAAEVTKLRGFEGFDYSSTKNMLSRTFMSRLRHAFVSGKYAIGIAAVNQTNHSLNQRQPIYIDRDMLENVPAEDKEWLGDGKIKFKEYNSMTINGKTVPVLSMIKNKAGDFISDLIGQFIDGYVDIAKGPWIMELGAAPNVASTWLFLIKVGVPIKSVAYFMNQPIIRDYLNKVENAGYSWLFIDSFVADTLKQYESEYEASDEIPSEKSLEGMIGDRKKLNKQQLAQQQVILREFLKYAKMASHMFMVTQGSNFDTSNFNDPFLVFKKNEQLKKAQNTIIASIDKDGKSVPAVNAILQNSFIGKLAYRINSVRDAYSEFLKSDKGRVRNVLENVLLPYIDTNDREFVKLARKAVSDLFDWAVQTDPTKKLNTTISKILLKDGGTAEELAELFETIKNSKKRDPYYALKNNYVVQTLIHDMNGEVNNMKLKNRDNKVYDQNKIIYAFEELRNYLNSKNQLPLYKRLVAMSILQSGLSTSPIAFTQLLPYEDFKNEYNQILGKLNTVSNLESFHTLGVFQRNNWSDDDIVAHSRARWIETKKGLRYNPAMEFLPNNVKKAVKEGEIPNVITISALSREATNEYIAYTWEKNDELLTEKELKELTWKQQRKVIKERKLAMKKKGDFSYINKGLFQRVKESDDVNSDSYVHMSSTGKPYFVYKMVNAWGNSFSANEFYTIGRKSVIDNNFLKVDEMSDGPILNAFIGEQTKQTKARRGSTVTKTVSTAPITADEASLRSQISALEEKKKTTGLSPAEIANLTKLQKELNKVIKSICKPKL